MGVIQELHKKLVSPRIAAPVVTVLWVWDVADVADVTYNAFIATRRCKILRASFIMESAATAVTSYTCQLKLGATALTNALDIKTLAADTGADFVPADVEIPDGGEVDVVFDQEGGTVTAPDQVCILMELQLLE